MKRIFLALLIDVLCVLSIAQVATAQKPATSSRPAGPTWQPYEPKASDFRPIFQNAAKGDPAQTWEEYWSWILEFYNGDEATPGWTTRVHEIILAEGRNRIALQERLDRLGKVISAEWAKDNSVRKITSLDLFLWGDRLDLAQQERKLRKDRVLSCVDSISAEAQNKLSIQPSSR